ncbi:MAG: response regulator transcription factor [Candidatus Dormiibacterota bacterium]
MIRVVLADDQPLVRLGLRVLLETEPDVELVGEAADGRATLEVVRRTHPDVVLLDIRMPELDGIETLKEIVADPALEATRVIMLTTFELDEYVFESLRGGASGFLTKDGEPVDLLHAIRVVAAGESLLSPTVTRRVIEAFAERVVPKRTPHPYLSTLTVRERQVVGLVAEGLHNDEIAERLFVSPDTVRTHVGRAMSKLEARDRAQLVVIAYQNGLAT